MSCGRSLWRRSSAVSTAPGSAARARTGRAPGWSTAGRSAPARPPVGRQPREIEAIGGKLADQERALVELAAHRGGADRRRPRAQPRVSRLRAINGEQSVERPADGFGELRLQALEGHFVRALARPCDRAHDHGDGGSLDPSAPQLAAGLGEEQRRPLVLEGALGQPGTHRLQLALTTGHEACVLAHKWPVLAPGLWPDRVVEDRARRDVKRVGERGHGLRRRAR